MKKYLHVSPPWYCFHPGNLRQPNVPLGAAYLVRAAIEAGWEAALWNGDLLPIGGENQYSEEMTAYSGYLVSHSNPNNPIWDELRHILQDARPDVVGITALTASYPSALRCAEIAKQELPGCVVVFGGPHPTALPGQVLKDSDKVDIVAVGEGERTLQDILVALVHSESLDGIPGTVTRSQTGYSRALVANLDDLNWPVRGLTLDPHGLLQRDHFGLVMSQRGCPYWCKFCASPELWTHKIRRRSAVDMAAEMAAIHRQFDTRYFSFEDDSFTLNKPRTIQLMQAIINTGLPTVPGFRWTCNTRPDAIDSERLDWMKRAGCAAVAIGIEFGSPRMLEKVEKQFTTDEVRQAVRAIKVAGLISSGQFMIGYPTETETEMWQTVALADELECESVMLSVATPLPGTRLYQEATALELIPETGIDWATVTTKNDGMLMTVERDGGHIPMPLEQRRELVARLQTAFDRIQAGTLDKKNQSRQWYENQYLPEAGPVYGIKK